MHFSTSTFFFMLTLASISSALPTPVQGNVVLKYVSPLSKSCAGAPFISQCRTADQAASAIATSFNKYNITYSGEMAAIIALMAFESGDFKYQVNQAHHPGQGTRNMQSAHYNVLYAKSIPSLAPSLAAITSAPGSDDYSNAVLDLLIKDDTIDFGSGAWFLTSQCTTDTRGSLQEGTQTGFELYMSHCVGVSADMDRLSYWQRAVTALHVISRR